MKTTDLSDYKVPVSIFEATDRALLREQDRKSACSNTENVQECTESEIQKEIKEKKRKFSYRFLF